MSDSGYASGSDKKDTSKMDVDKVNATAASPTPSSLKRKASTENAKTADKAAKKPVAKKAKVETNGLVELKNGRFTLKQKALPLNNLVSTLQEQVALRAYLDAQPGPIKEVPEEHHAVFAKLTHESEKTLNDLAKYIKGLLDPENEDSQGQSDKLSIKVIKQVMDDIGERMNHGLDSSDLLGDDATPAASLCIWRFEVTKIELLPADMREKHDARRIEREAAPASCRALLKALPDDERIAILTKSSKRAPAKAKEPAKAKKPTAAVTSTDIVDLDGDEDADKMDVDKPVSSAKKGKAKAVEPVEETPEEKEKREAEEADKAEKKAEAARKKAERDAKKGEKEAKEAVKAKAIKASAGIMGSWLGAKPAAKPIAGPSSSPEVVRVAKPTSVSKSDVSDFDKVFLPFQPKKGSSVAPHNRFLGKRAAATDLPLNTRDDLTLDAVLQELTLGARKITSTTRPKPPVIVAEIMQGITEGDLRGDGGRKYYNQLRNRSKLPVKTLMFAGDRRPGYRGTWTKSSYVIRPRNPFAMDLAALNYEYDSADDWDGEGDEEGEDVASGEDDAEDMSEDEEDDGWLAGDDEIEYEEGFDANGEMMGEGVDGDADAQAKRIVAKRSQAAANRKRKATGPLAQLIKGPCWEAADGKPEWEVLAGFRIQFLNDAHFGIDPLTFAPTQPEVFVKPGQPAIKGYFGAASSGTANGKPAKASTSKKTAPVDGSVPVRRGPHKTVFPVEEMPAFIDFVKASDVQTKDDLRSALYIRFPTQTKACIEPLVKKISKEGNAKTGVRWTVAAEILELAKTAPATAPEASASMT